MALDTHLEHSIKTAVSNAGQSNKLTEKIIAWLNAIISGNEFVHDQQQAFRHIQLLYDEIVSTDEIEDV